MAEVISFKNAKERQAEHRTAKRLTGVVSGIEKHLTQLRKQQSWNVTNDIIAPMLDEAITVYERSRLANINAIIQIRAGDV